MPRQPTDKQPRKPKPAKAAVESSAPDTLTPFQPPANPDELHHWLLSNLGLRFPRIALVDGHTAPFDYLCHTFFEGRGSWPAADAPQPASVAPADCVVWANRGGGKTFLGAVATMLDLVFKPGIEVRILGGSLDQSSRMHTHLRTLFAHEALAGLVDGRITDRRIRLVNTSAVELLAQSQTSVRGTRVQKLRCDEVELFDPLVWEAAQLTTRGKLCAGVPVRGSVECLSTMHVPHGIMARLVEDARKSRSRLFKWGLIDALEHCGDEHHCRGIAFPGDEVGPARTPPSQAPSHAPDPTEASAGKPMPRHVPLPILNAPADCPLLPECAERAKQKEREPGHITVEDALIQKSRVSLATWESEMLCLRPRRSDCVLPEFSPALHIVTELPWEPAQPAAWVGGMDFGFRASVILWAGIDASGLVCIADERFSENVILDEHIEAIRAGLGRPWPALAWIGVDPAGSARNDQTGAGSAQILRDAGLTVRARRMSIVEGLSLIRARLRPADGPPRLLIHERCRRLIEALEKYHYPADRPDSLTPVKDGHDHAVDALRYLMLNLDRPYKTTRSEYC